VAFKRREEPSIDEERQALRAQHAALEDLKRQLAERVEAVRERELELHHVLAEAGSRPIEAAAPLPPQRPPARAAADEDDTGEDALAAQRREEELGERERAMAERETRAREREAEIERQAQALATVTAAASVARETGPEQGTAVIRAADVAAEAAALAAATAAAEAEERLARIEARLAELREAEKMFLRTRDELAARSEAVAARERLVAQKERELDEREDASPWATAELSEVEARLRRLEQQAAPAAEQTAGFTGGLRKLQQGAKKPPRSV
jgi:hypothetical protein